MFLVVSMETNNAVITICYTQLYEMPTSCSVLCVHPHWVCMYTQHYAIASIPMSVDFD